jgi:hypothetical protein
MKRLKIDAETLISESTKLYDFIRENINNAEIELPTTDIESKKEIILCAIKMLMIDVIQVNNKNGKANINKTCEAFNKRLDLMKLGIPKNNDKLPHGIKRVAVNGKETVNSKELEEINEKFKKDGCITFTEIKK